MKTEKNQPDNTLENEENEKRINSQLQDEPLSNPLPKPIQKRNSKKRIFPSPQTTKDIENFVQKVSNESRGVLYSMHDFIGGEWKDQLQPKTREAELKKIRKQKNQDRELEISR